MRLPLLKNPIERLRSAALLGIIGAAGLMGVGCDTPSFLDPGEMAATREGNVREPLRVKVLDHLDPTLEQTDQSFANSGPPRQEDLTTTPTDYAVGPSDLLQVTIYDLEGQGLQTIKQVRISGTGNIALPYLQNVVRAEGLTEIELQTTVAEAYREAKILEQPNVSVSVVEARNKTYTVFGSVARPGTYVISDDEFRLLEALVQAGDVSSALLTEIYVFRRTDAPGAGAGGTGADTRPAGGAGAGTTQPAGAADDLAPQSNSRRLPSKLSKSLLMQEQGAADPLAPEASEGETPAATPTVDRNAVALEPEVVAESSDDAAARVGRIDGEEVVVQPTDDAAAAQPAAGGVETAQGTFEFNELAPPDNIRVIRIPLDRLRNGEFQYNIAIRPRDEIYIPPGVVGYYYMGGHVARPGPFRFDGQKLTLKQAITSAGGLDGLAIPQRTDIIRRIGTNEEMYVRVDLAAVFAGKRPDIYLKPDDHVMVGTNFLAPFLAAIRGGFRMTYGFGFLYDRNYAYDQDQQR